MTHETTVTYRGAFNWLASCSCGWEKGQCFLERDAMNIASAHERSDSPSSD